MSDELRQLGIAVGVLCGLAIIFAVVVVVLTRTRLDLGGGDPLGRAPSSGAECYELVRSAAEALRGGRHADAHEALRGAESLRCGDEVTLRIGQLYREVGDVEAAIRVLGSSQEAPSPQRLAELAGALFDAGRVDSARVLFRRVLASPGLPPHLVRSLAWMALDLKETAHADSLFSRALRLFPLDADLWRALADITLREGHTDRALAAARRAVELAPSSCRASLTLGWCHEAGDDTASALEAFSQALALCPSDPFVSFEVGRFHHRGGRDVEALPLLIEATEDARCPLDWLLLRASVERSLGMFDHARSTLRRAQGRADADHRPFLEQAKIEWWHGDRGLARSLAARAQELAPQDASVRDFLARIG